VTEASSVETTARLSSPPRPAIGLAATCIPGTLTPAFCVSVSKRRRRRRRRPSGQAGGGGDDDGGDEGGGDGGGGDDGFSGWFDGWEEEPEDEGSNDPACATYDFNWAWRCCLAVMMLQMVHTLTAHSAEGTAGRALGALAAAPVPGAAPASHQFATVSAGFYSRTRQAAQQTAVPTC